MALSSLLMEAKPSHVKTDTLPSAVDREKLRSGFGVLSKMLSLQNLFTNPFLVTCSEFNGSKELPCFALIFLTSL